MIKVGGIVLCGGRSERMGKPKSWLPFGPELLLQRVVRRLSEAVTPVVVVAAKGQELPALPAAVILAWDEVAERGPLQGLAAGLRALPSDLDAAFLSACDMPFLQPAFVRRVIDLLGENTICVPRVDGYFHPLAAAYRRQVLDTIDQLLRFNRLRPMDLFDNLPTRVVEARELEDVDPALASLRNVNMPDDYLAALRDFELSEHPKRLVVEADRADC